ncbi:MAG: hydroxyacid dehydrogenase [Verrucomicrobiales bacterium]|nr:hydroxyacid dehydrogenase [Verrucomicrobiales bacterium]
MILITENITGTAITQLREQLDVRFEPELWAQPDQLKTSLKGIKALIVRNQTQVTADIIAAADDLQIIARAGAGLDNIDTQAASAAGIVVTSTPQANSLSVAELAVGLMLSLARQIPAADWDTRAGGWNRQVFTGSELSGKTLGVVGFGRIGALTATRAKVFGMNIVAHDDYVDPDADYVKELDAKMLGLDDLLSQADFITCHVPLTDSTREMFNDELFGKMKPGAFFINTSRGEVADEAALARAMQKEQLAGAALDVRQVEPPDASSPLNSLSNVILTPHIAAFTNEAQTRVVDAVCRDVRAILKGEPATDFFNFPKPQSCS